MKLNNSLIYVSVALTTLLLIIGLGTVLLVERVSDRVIQKLKQEYSPSPYGPTIDPDKVDLNRLDN